MFKTYQRQALRCMSSAYRAHAKKSRSTLYTGAAIVGTGGVAGYLGYLYASASGKGDSKVLFPLGSKTKLQDLDSPVYLDPEFDLAQFRERLGQIVREQDISFKKTDIDDHSFNNYTLHKPKDNERPYVIVFPQDTDHVSEIMKLCYEFKVPVIPFAGGTSIEGQFVSTRNIKDSAAASEEQNNTVTLVLDFNKYMNKVIKINVDDLDCVVQPGVVAKQLNDEHLNQLGLMFGPDGAPGCEIGGQIGTSCSGTNAYRYGTMKENVVNMTVVLADGTIIKTRQRPKKSSNGYNLTGLFIGSEGTLGVVTEATVKLHVKPIYETISIVSFEDLSKASHLVQLLTKKGILGINAIELLDGNMMKAINFSGQTSRKWKEQPTLLFKLGSHNKKILKEVVNDIKKLSKDAQCTSCEFAETHEQQEELWSARKAIFWSSIDYGRHLFGPDVKIWSTDIAVPVSKLASVIDETLEEVTSSGLYGTIVGHVGDGNFHCLVMYNDTNEKKALEVIDNMNIRAIANEGTCSGEHGIGTSKRKFLALELGDDTISVMRRIKMALDPSRILNPDKLFKIDPSDKND
ncbi:D-lactate dehydrogenase [Kluyveromyces marxianus]|nr:D-lactate dehydrogenase [Kluyveromyces marxianus]